MKHKSIVITLLPFMFVFIFSNCKKDCKGTYTVNGTLWNGTKNKPYIKTKVDFTGGGASNLFSSSVNAKDLGTVYTNEDGKFIFTYNCINEDDWSVGFIPRIGSTLLNYTVAKNQDVTETYNIPDSVSLDLFIRQKNNFNTTDTLFLLIAMPDMIKEYSFIHLNIPNGFYKRFRLPYKDAISKKYSLAIVYAVGYNNYKIAQNTDWSAQNKNNISKPEPEINEFTIFY